MLLYQHFQGVSFYLDEILDVFLDVLSKDRLFNFIAVCFSRSLEMCVYMSSVVLIFLCRSLCCASFGFTPSSYNRVACECLKPCGEM